MISASLKAYAKVNLSLDVVGKLANGYHEIRSVMQAIDLCDDVFVEVFDCDGDRNGCGAEYPCDISLTVKGNSEGVPTDHSNIAYKAAVAFLDRFANTQHKLRPSKIKIELTKRIPAAAGLAGGSTNAAAILLLLAHVTKLTPRPTSTDLFDLAKHLGADVPFCLAANGKANDLTPSPIDIVSTTCLAEGIGDRLTPTGAPAGSMLLIKPNIAVTTKEIYDAYDNAAPPSARPGTEPTLPIKDMINVLEPITTAKYPVVSEIIQDLRTWSNADQVLMSGSGPTVLAYYPSTPSNRPQEDLETAKAKYTPQGYFVHLSTLL